MISPTEESTRLVLNIQGSKGFVFPIATPELAL